MCLILKEHPEYVFVSVRVRVRKCKQKIDASTLIDIRLERM